MLRRTRCYSRRGRMCRRRRRQRTLTGGEFNRFINKFLTSASTVANVVLFGPLGFLFAQPITILPEPQEPPELPPYDLTPWINFADWSFVFSIWNRFDWSIPIYSTWSVEGAFLRLGTQIRTMFHMLFNERNIEKYFILNSVITVKLSQWNVWNDFTLLYTNSAALKFALLCRSIQMWETFRPEVTLLAESARSDKLIRSAESSPIEEFHNVPQQLHSTNESALFHKRCMLYLSKNNHRLRWISIHSVQSWGAHSSGCNRVATLEELQKRSVCDEINKKSS